MDTPDELLDIVEEVLVSQAAIFLKNVATKRCDSPLRAELVQWRCLAFGVRCEVGGDEVIAGHVLDTDTVPLDGFPHNPRFRSLGRSVTSNGGEATDTVFAQTRTPLGTHRHTDS